jgi:hypothetical protein
MSERWPNDQFALTSGEASVSSGLTAFWPIPPPQTHPTSSKAIRVATLLPQARASLATSVILRTAALIYATQSREPMQLLILL